jgi:hypothetical protein
VGGDWTTDDVASGDATDDSTLTVAAEIADSSNGDGFELG